MKLLFIHQNFPGQFRHIAAHFAADPGNRVVAIGEAPNLKKAAAIHPRIEQRPYASPQPANAGTHRYVQGYEAAVQRGLAVADVAARLKTDGFIPDLIVAHPGWGEALYLRDPDENGVELYWDRPEAEWPRHPDGTLAMFTHRLDVDALLRARET